ncbi:unnamed protein product [Zymoseptoria tritici ST99CH_1E4]|uniref:Uncharacterized protein n=1 Tax=Zymoseptoria tritici ST99CH_1E4 TaxID=1276532 RepID=A0A2H1H9P3_ZYMTR|nr:unnamed protein product [Zymoseptoria tritici ST99CH_1E4]
MRISEDDELDQRFGEYCTSEHELARVIGTVSGAHRLPVPRLQRLSLANGGWCGTTHCSSLASSAAFFAEHARRSWCRTEQERITGFVKRFWEELGFDGHDGGDEYEDDEDGEEDHDDEDESNGTDETDEGANFDGFETLLTVEPLQALKRPPPRLAELLIGDTTPLEEQDTSIDGSRRRY